MKQLLFNIFILIFLLGCKNKSKDYSDFQAKILYPVYENCENKQSNKEQLKCMGQELNIFYHYYLTEKYPTFIKNKEDSIMLWLQIDTLGQLSVDKIEHSSLEKNNQLDSILELITKESPIFVPAKYENKKINFQFKLPVILTK